MSNINKIIIISYKASKQIVKNKIAKANYIIGVDQGYNLINSFPINFDLVIGDFDSLKNKIQNEKIIKLNPNKNHTDLYYAIKYVKNEFIHQKIAIEIITTLDGRFDHVLAVISTLCNFENLNIKIIDENNEITLLLPGKHNFKQTKKYKYISFYPITFPIENLKLENFKYNDKQLKINSLTDKYISNEIINNTNILEFSKGKIICVKSKDKEKNVF